MAGPLSLKVNQTKLNLEKGWDLTFQNDKRKTENDVNERRKKKAVLCVLMYE